MVKVLNLLKQPLSINLSQDESVIFLSRETKELTIEQYNSEGIQNYIRKGLLLVLEINE